METVITSALGQGLLYAFMVLGVFITFRVLDFPDLTVDGSLPLGAAVTATLIVHGQSPWLATLVRDGGGHLRRPGHGRAAHPPQDAVRPTPTTTGRSCSPASSP